MAAVVLLLCSPFAAAQYAQTLSDQLLKHTVVLRNYYTDKDLKFGADGKLVSDGATGFGPADARVFLEQMHLSPDSLVLVGQHTFPVYQPATGDFKLTLIGDKVTITIALPTEKPPSEIVPALLGRVFVPQSELDQTRCSSEEQQDFLKAIVRVITPQSKKKGPKEPPPSQLVQYCVPDGGMVYRVGNGVTPPKALKTPDPSYSDQARHDGIQGTVILQIVIDAQGRPTTMYIIRSLGHGLDEAAVRAVENWQFRPATLNGTPVPVTINIEINFRLT